MSARKVLVWGLLISLLVAGGAIAQQVPPEVSRYYGDWPLPHYDYANTRATEFSTINSSNVSTLGAAWVHNVPSGQSTYGSISTMPIIIGDTVYLQDLGDNFMALDVATGEQRWQTVYNLANLGPSGVSVGYGKVYGTASPYAVVALDALTGKEIWRTTLIDVKHDGQTGIDMQTTVYNGLVYISTVPGNAGVFYAGGGMGIIYALDAETGEIVWSFNTVDSPTLWGNSAINSGGGCWFPPAIDVRTGKTYFSVANPAPWPGQSKTANIPQDWPNGSSRPGPNLYTNSLLQLDHASGALDWFTQVWPHDLTDYDLQQSPILATAMWEGRPLDIILAAGKMGRVYAMERGTGDLLWVTEVGEHQNDNLLAFPTDGTSVTVFPGFYGGVESPMAYADGVVYVAANNLAADYTGTTNRLHTSFADATGDLVAIDVDTGRIIWDQPIGAALFGGATVVNDLVFTGDFNGSLYAFKRDTGEKVWTYQAPAGVNAWPSVSGDTLVWPIAGPGTASVIGFRLNATEPAIKIVTPGNGADLPAGDLTITTEVTNFNLVDKLGDSNVSGEGHIHYYLDVAAPTTAGQPAIPASGATWAATPSTTYTFKNVAAGQHTVSVELVNNDHTPLNPPVVRTIEVTTDNNPRISISSPPNGAILKTGDITISVDVTDFNLVDKLGQANAQGEGHIHYFMDVKPPTTAGQPAIPASGSTWAATAATSYTFKNVPVGIHYFYVELVNNDHTPLEPALTAERQVYVIDYTGGIPLQ